MHTALSFLCYIVHTRYLKICFITDNLNYQCDHPNMQSGPETEAFTDYSECFHSERGRIEENQQTLANSRYTARLHLMRSPTLEIANNPWWDPIFFPPIIYSLGLSSLQLLALQPERSIFFSIICLPHPWRVTWTICPLWGLSKIFSAIGTACRNLIIQ